MRYGIGKLIRQKKLERYYDLKNEVETYIDSLSGKPKMIMKMYYIDGLSCISIGHRIGYSDRQVRRIKKSTLSKLD